MRGVAVTDVKGLCGVQTDRNISSCPGEPYARTGDSGKDP